MSPRQPKTKAYLVLQPLTPTDGGGLVMPGEIVDNLTPEQAETLISMGVVEETGSTSAIAVEKEVIDAADDGST